MMTILSSSSWNTFLDCARLLLLDEDSTSSPILNMEKPHLGTSSHIHYHQIYGKLQAYSLFEMSILNLHFVLINLVSFLLTSWWWCLEGKHDYSLNLLILQDMLAIGSTLTWPLFGSSLNITLVNTWSSLLYSSFHLETNIWSTSITYGQDLQVYLNINISP